MPRRSYFREAVAAPAVPVLRPLRMLFRRAVADPPVDLPPKQSRTAESPAAPTSAPAPLRETSSVAPAAQPVSVEKAPEAPVRPERAQPLATPPIQPPARKEASPTPEIPAPEDARSTPPAPQRMVERTHEVRVQHVQPHVENSAETPPEPVSVPRPVTVEKQVPVVVSRVERRTTDAHRDRVPAPALPAAAADEPKRVAPPLVRVAPAAETPSIEIGEIHVRLTPPEPQPRPEPPKRTPAPIGRMNRSWGIAQR